MQSTEVPAGRSASAGRRRAERPSPARALRAKWSSIGVPPVTSWSGAVWTVAIALDFFWLSIPYVFTEFDESRQLACVATVIAVLLTLPRMRVRRPSWAVVAMLAFAFSSALWSGDPRLTVSFTTDYLVIATIATVIAWSASARTVAQGITLGGVVIFTTSVYAFRAGLPLADVPPGGQGYLAGVGANRNILSYTLVLALCFAISFMPRYWWARLMWALGLGSILVGIFLAQSSTGYIAALVLLCSAATLAWLDRPRAAGTVRTALRGRRALLPLVAVVVAGAVALEILGRLLGRDTSTLSGRVPLWQAVWESTTGLDRWVGAGWGAVWPHPWHPASSSGLYTDIIDRADITLLHGHNSFFDLLPEVGLVGSAVFALVYVQTVWSALRLRDPRRRPYPGRAAASRAMLLGVLALVLLGLTEPMSTIPLGWFIAALLATGLRPPPVRPVTVKSAPGADLTRASRHRGGSRRAR
ncbi:hypothetical protein GCM10023350_38150 [Nocardioides endophyticus]|uniref:O-antigen ligase family protein n=1 Tax=Nocardioides endophyticus TaxID=1353775 RepID=A0ABP8Z893_9ACTN